MKNLEIAYLLLASSLLGLARSSNSPSQQLDADQLSSPRVPPLTPDQLTTWTSKHTAVVTPSDAGLAGDIPTAERAHQILRLAQGPTAAETAGGAEGQDRDWDAETAWKWGGELDGFEELDLEDGEGTPVDATQSHAAGGCNHSTTVNPIHDNATNPAAAPCALAMARDGQKRWSAGWAKCCDFFCACEDGESDVHLCSPCVAYEKRLDKMEGADEHCCCDMTKKECFICPVAFLVWAAQMAVLGGIIYGFVVLDQKEPEVARILFLIFLAPFAALFGGGFVCFNCLMPCCSSCGCCAGNDVPTCLDVWC